MEVELENPLLDMLRMIFLVSFSHWKLHHVGWGIYIFLFCSFVAGAYCFVILRNHEILGDLVIYVLASSFQ